MCFARAASGRSLDDSRSRSQTDGDGKREGEKKRGWQEEWRMEEERQCRQAKHKGMRQRHCFPLPRQTIVCTLHLPLPNRSRLGVSVRPTRPDQSRPAQDVHHHQCPERRSLQTLVSFLSAYSEGSAKTARSNCIRWREDIAPSLATSYCARCSVRHDSGQETRSQSGFKTPQFLLQSPSAI